ncbi:MAG: hypothetical protein LKF31_03920 [Muribaculaceae bacterium]|jgi:hypothetical protein|nr:hypothetical protein [Muribaculaceae bacterium]
MSYSDKIESPRFPLWKTKLSDTDFSRLCATLQNANEQKTLQNYGREAAFYYAEWWKRKFNGGIPSKIEIANSLGIHDSEYFFNLAKTAFRNWHQNFIRGKRNEFFRTLLLQGGLPINYIVKEENWSSYTRFLQAIISELSNRYVDWSDSSLISSLSCITYLPKSFQNEQIFDLSLQIAHAIIESRMDLLPFSTDDERFKDLADCLKKCVRRKSKSLFSCQWHLKLNNDKSQLYYSISLPKSISSTVVNIPLTVYTFDIYVSDKFVAKYKRNLYSEEDSISEYCMIDNQNHDFLWHGEVMIQVKLILNDNDGKYLTVPNCCPPDFSVPQVFQKFDNIFVQRNTKNSTENIIVFNAPWKSRDNAIIECAINNQKMCYIEFSNSATLINTETNEERTFNNKFTKYQVDFRNIFVDWIEESNFKLLDKLPAISIYDENGDMVNAKFKTYYRTRKGKDWEIMDEDSNLSNGIIDIKILLPDNESVITSFYYIGGLNFKSYNETIDSAEVEFHDVGGMIVSAQKQDNIIINDNDTPNSFHLERQSDMSSFPTTCTFYFTYNNNPTLKLIIASPFKGLCILKGYNEIVDDGSYISLNRLFDYHIFAQQVGKVTAMVSYCNLKDEVGESKFLIKEVHTGISQLSDLEDFIKRMFVMYDINIFDRDSSIKVSLQSSNYDTNIVYIKRHSLDTVVDENGKCHIIGFSTLNGGSVNIAKQCSLLAYPLNVTKENREVIPVEHDSGTGYYTFPYSLKENPEYIIFSEAGDEQRIIPRYYNLDDPDDSIENRHRMRSQRLFNWNRDLSKEAVSGLHWQEVFNCYKIVIDNDLYFKTFDCFTVISNNPILIIKFVLGLYFYGKDSVPEFNRFTNEFAISLHWICYDLWCEVFSDFLGNISTEEFVYFSKRLIEFIKTIFDTELDSSYTEYISNYILIPNCTQQVSKFNNNDLLRYRSLIHGVSMGNEDLPCSKINLETYILKNLDLGERDFYKTAILSPIKIAEALSNKYLNEQLWLKENAETRRIINFYRIYQLPVYTEILYKAIGYYENINK